MPTSTSYKAKLTILITLLIISTHIAILSAQTEDEEFYLPYITHAEPSSTPAPTPAPTVQPTTTPPETNICSSDIYNCKDFPTQQAAQDLYEFCLSQGAGDIHGLDGNNDGEACEGNPRFIYSTDLTLDDAVQTP